MAETASFLGPVARLWWVHLPLAVRRVSERTAAVMVDGLFLTAWPRPAALAPPLALAAGFGVGWKHPGFQTVFSESFEVMAVAAVLGALGANLGLWFVLGFASGDFLLAHPSWTPPDPVLGRAAGGWGLYLARTRLPLLIEYGLLAVLTVRIPLVTRAVVQQIRLPLGLPRRLRFGLAVATWVVVAGLLVHLWTRTVPVLIRPVFTWPRAPFRIRPGRPPVEAMAPLFQQGSALAVVAGAAALARMLLQAATASTPRLRQSLDRARDVLTAAPPAAPAGGRASAWVRTVLSAGWAVLLLSGMYEAWVDAALIAVLVLVVLAAHAGLIRLPLGRWPEVAARIPFLLRLAGGLVLVYWLSRSVLERLPLGGESFRPLLWLTALAISVLFLANPGIRPQREGA